MNAAAAACGEACIVAAGELDPESHEFAPGSAVLSDRVNQILIGDAQQWDSAGLSVFGIIWSGALAHGYHPDDFPPIVEPIRNYVESLGSASEGMEDRWGRVALSVPSGNLPRVQPLRIAYELRPLVRMLRDGATVERRQWPTVCAMSMVVELARVRQAIDPGVAIRFTLETINGMAKMAPMTARHMEQLKK